MQHCVAATHNRARIGQTSDSPPFAPLEPMRCVTMTHHARRASSQRPVTRQRQMHRSVFRCLLLGGLASQPSQHGSQVKTRLHLRILCRLHLASSTFPERTRPTVPSLGLQSFRQFFFTNTTKLQYFLNHPPSTLGTPHSVKTVNFPLWSTLRGRVKWELFLYCFRLSVRSKKKKNTLLLPTDEPPPPPLAHFPVRGASKVMAGLCLIKQQHIFVALFISPHPHVMLPSLRLQ
jgi:hypothetical protein